MKKLFSTIVFSWILSACNTAEISTPGDRMFTKYFESETKRISKKTLSEIETIEDWNTKKTQYRDQLHEMLGLDPLPARTPLKTKITGIVKHDKFEVQKLHYQSSPKLYVTANLYVPKNISHPVPAILYVCGHGRVKIDGINYGNKTHYQHHGAWFARNGYACLVIDTIQLGELEGLHHGTYSHDMWWWNSRGYTPAGVEAWNGIRAIDLLESLNYVDKSRIGITGRSGGGAYTWWIAALDDRIKVAAPVAGITDLKNHVIDGVIEGHCDCMFHINTYSWDFAQVASLVAPRPLLILNTDRDSIFPLNGVTRLHNQIKKIYKLHKKTENLGLVITPGGHSDSQELRIPVFNWFNKHFKGETTLINQTATKLFTPKQLKVFKTEPKDQQTTTIHDYFSKTKNNDSPISQEAVELIRQKAFGGWPVTYPAHNLKKVWDITYNKIHFTAYDFESQKNIRLRMYIAQKSGPEKAKSIHIHALNENSWEQFLTSSQLILGEQLREEIAISDIKKNNLINDKVKSKLAKKLNRIHNHSEVHITFVPRGLGLSKLTSNKRHNIQTRRRFMLLGQTLAGQQAFDIIQCIRATRSLDIYKSIPLELWGDGHTSSLITISAIFQKGIHKINLLNYPKTDKEQPDYLNISRFATPLQLLELAKRNTQVMMTKNDK